jgi:hypothetical protein
MVGFYSRWRTLRLDLMKVVVATYVLAAALLPLSHHDIACHFKSTTHCTTCIIGSSAEAADDSATLTHAQFVDAGQAAGEISAPALSTVDESTAGRSPPARG